VRTYWKQVNGQWVQITEYEGGGSSSSREKDFDPRTDPDYYKSIAAASGARPSDFEGGGDRSSAHEFGSDLGSTVYGAVGERALGPVGGYLGSAFGEHVIGGVVDCADYIAGGAISNWLDANPGVKTAAKVASYLPLGGGSASSKADDLARGLTKQGGRIAREGADETADQLARRGIKGGGAKNVDNVAGGGSSHGGPPLTGRRASGDGGVYHWIDPDTGKVLRTGRSDDMGARERDYYYKDPETYRRLKFKRAHETNDRAEQKGLEEMEFLEHNPPLNTNHPVSLRNKRRNEYFQAAAEYYWRNRGQ